jgi:cold shock CspA family protein/arsenate reductase-like glutaredoxin family protein
MIKGTVKFYNQGKGFGFITPDDGGADVFVPATTLSASNVSSLKAGQRVRFEIQPDKKGAKAGRLVIDAVNPPEEQPTRPTATVHYDPSSEESMDVLATLNALGEKFLSVDYVASPPSQDQLQRLSILLRDGSQSLVRRYHPLFLGLQLDDRFIGENEFWTAIIEHPQLINGPILALGNRARICKTEGEVRSFFGVGGNLEQRPKAISPRILALIKGGSAEPRPESGVVNTLKESARSAPTKAAPKENTRQRVTEKRKEKWTPPTKKKSKAKVAPKVRPQTKKTARKKK